MSILESWISLFSLTATAKVETTKDTRQWAAAVAVAQGSFADHSIWQVFFSGGSIASLDHQYPVYSSASLTFTLGLSCDSSMVTFMFVMTWSNSMGSMNAIRSRCTWILTCWFRKGSNNDESRRREKHREWWLAIELSNDLISINLFLANPDIAMVTVLIPNTTRMNWSTCDVSLSFDLYKRHATATLVTAEHSAQSPQTFWSVAMSLITLLISDKYETHLRLNEPFHIASYPKNHH